MIAEELGISVRTVYKWLRRHRLGGPSALANASSAPVRRPRRLARHRIALVLYLRRTYRLTAATIADKLGLALSWGMLEVSWSSGLSRSIPGRSAANTPRWSPVILTTSQDQPRHLYHSRI